MLIAFLPGRSLLAGQVRPDYRGGLCQLSGRIYYASLMAGLETPERHPHSRDIYDDQTRYAPLGADATVAYGFKELHVLNNLPFPVCSPEPIEESQMHFAKTATGNELTLVETRRRLRSQDGNRVLDVSSYRCLDSRCRVEDSSIL